MEFIHSVLAQNEAVTAGTVISYDLPVNPLSFIMCTLKFQQNKANEAMDWDERRVLLEERGKSPNSLKLVGATPTALALQIGPHKE